MKLFRYKSENIEEIKQLVYKIFSDSAGKSEGNLIEKLVSDLVTDIENHDLYIHCF